MTLYQIKEQLQQETTLTLELPNGSLSTQSFSCNRSWKSNQAFHRLWWHD